MTTEDYKEKIRILEGRIQGLLVERDEAVAKAQRQEELRDQSTAVCDRLHKQLQVEVRDVRWSPGSLADVQKEIKRAREKFPSNRHLLAALGEEYGELCEAMLENQGKDRVYSEAKQVACVAIWIMEEGDSDFDVYAPCTGCGEPTAKGICGICRGLNP